MGLEFYDDQQVLITSLDRFRSHINGYQGGSYEEKIYLRNDDVTRWFTNISVSVESSVYDGIGELGISGISFKFIYGERRPTEAEWDIVESGMPISIPDIGIRSTADTSTYHPVWCRIYIPGGTSAGIDDSFIFRVSYLPRVVVP